MVTVMMLCMCMCMCMALRMTLYSFDESRRIFSEEEYSMVHVVVEEDERGRDVVVLWLGVGVAGKEVLRGGVYLRLIFLMLRV